MDATTFAILAGCSLAAAVIGLALLSLTTRRPANLSVNGGRLSPCPNKPNCVCTQASDERHRIEPLTYAETAEEAVTRLREVLRERPRTRIVRQTESYLHAECTSFLFRFVDDMEFLIDGEAKMIHFRSASRAGHSDLGVNRRRMEEIRREFNASPSASAKD